MATLRLQINGEPSAVTYRGFVAALGDWFKMLLDLDSGISGAPRGSLDWVVTGLSMGSLAVEVESQYFTISVMAGKDKR